MKIFMKPLNITFSVLLYFLSIAPVLATSLLPISLEQLSTRASLIFYGTVISNEVRKDTQSGYVATFTEFKIIDLIKGEAADKFTIKQIGGHFKENNIALRIHGVPEFKTGNSYVVFLPEKSSLGFSSPLGLHQGSFSVSDINGEQIVSSGQNLSAVPSTLANNKATLIPLAVVSDKPSRTRLVDFINTVRAYNTP